MNPVRLQLSRRKGYRLQALSRATNGLSAVNCARPSKWGNPYPIGNAKNGGFTRAEAIRLHREECMRALAKRPDTFEPLRGKNLACHCGPDEACHVDTYLELANR